MTYVRDRIRQPQSKSSAKHRCALRPANTAGNFPGALDWFRAAAAYAGRRSYRTLSIGEAAIARRDRIVAEAAKVLQDCACEIDSLVPASFSSSPRRPEFRAAYLSVASPRDQLNAARAWLMFTMRRAERYERRKAGAMAEAAAIQERAITRLIEWAKEFDSDNYGE